MTDVRIFSRPLLAQHIAAVATFAVFGLFWIHARRDPVITFDGHLVDKVVQVGGQVVERAVIQRLRGDCTVTLHAEVLDASKSSRKLPDVKIDPANRQITHGPIIVHRQHTVPSSAAIGPAELVLQRDYTCWPFYGLLPIRTTPRSFHFVIVDRDPATPQ